MTLSRHSGVPLYRQVEAALSERMDSGDLAPGARLPAETDLARHFGVNRLTVRQAIGELARSGHVRVQHGVGTFVTSPVGMVDVSVAALTLDAAQMRAQAGFREMGWDVQETLLDSGPGDDDSARAALAVPPDAALHRIRTLISISGSPWTLSSYWLAEAAVPGITEALDGSGDVLGIVQSSYGLALHYAWRSFAAVAATTSDAELLDIPAGSPLLLREGLNRDHTGRSLVYVHRRVRPDRARFVLHYPERERL